MDRGTKIYALILAIIAIFITFNILYESPKVGELNQRLEKLPSIARFPYQFKVVEVNDGIATMSSPRSTEVPVNKILRILFPEVAGISPQSELFQQAQKKLAKVQTLARDTVVNDPDIKRVKWHLDENWLFQHGISINSY